MKMRDRLRVFWRYDVKPWFAAKEENMWLWIGRNMPTKMRYWATVVSGAQATTGEYGSEEAPAVLFMDVLKRIEPTYRTDS